MKRIIRVAAVVGALSMTLAACGSAPGAQETPTAGTVVPTIDFKACIVSDAGGFDDKSFNQLSFEGAKKAAAELGATFVPVESKSETDFQPNLESLVGEKCNLIVSVGFALSAATVESAKANPSIEYVLIDDAADNDFDGVKDADNIKPLLYDTAQAAFLAGYLSAGHSQAGKVGTFGGQPYPTVTIFMDGFKQGVDYYNTTKSASVSVVGYTSGDDGLFTGGFDANDTAKGIATQVIDQGVDVLLPVGGPIYQSAIAAIQDSGRDIALIGVDADLFLTDPSTDAIVLTSIEKKMDVSTYDAVMAAGKGNFDPNTYVGTLANGGVGLAPLHNFTDKVAPALWAEVQTLQQDIIDGKVTVTSYLDK